MRHQEIKDRKR